MLHLRLLPKLQPVPPKRTATSSIITPRERNVFSWFCMIFEYMILILIACLISHTLNDLLFIIYYKFVITFPMSFCLTHSTQKLRASFSDFLWLAHCEKCPNTEYFPGPYFPVFGLNTEIYGVNLRIQFKYGKKRTRKTSVFGHFLRSDIITLVFFYS